MHWEMRYKRLFTDFANYRKRVATEREALEQKAKMRVLTGILPLYDDFKRLLDHSPEETRVSESLNALHNKWQEWLMRSNIESLACLNADFDHTMHHAILQEKVSDPALDGKIVRVLEDGYRVDETIIRHAKVVVGRYENQLDDDRAIRLEA